MTRRLIGDVYWLANCHADDGRHLHLSEYLIRGDDGTVLVDSGSSLHRDEIITKTNQLTDGAGPDVVLLTHSTLPHTENVPAFESEWGKLETIAATGRFPEIVGLPNARPRRLNRPVEFVGRPITCIHPLLTDVTVSQWAYDHESGVLFTAEAFGHYHDPDACELTSGELDGGIPDEHLRRFYLDKLPFIDYLDPDSLETAFEQLFDILDVSYIAPIHGNPVNAGDIDDYLADALRTVRTPTADR